MKDTGRIAFAVGIGWLAFWAGVAANSINQLIEIPSPGEKYGWKILPLTLITLTIPFITGFLAGKKWNK